MFQRIAVICNYQLLPERARVMDCFFWEVGRNWRKNNIEIGWFFPNKANNRNNSDLAIYCNGAENIENYFLSFYNQNKKRIAEILLKL